MRRTALHHASARGRAEVVRVLIEAGAHVNVSTKQGDTPLHLAAMDIEHGPNVCVELMKAGASYCAKTSLGWTPLHSAMYSDNEEVARLLIHRPANALVGLEHAAVVFPRTVGAASAVPHALPT